MWTSLQPRNWYRWKRAAAMTTRNHHTPFWMRRRLKKSQFMGQREGEWNSSMYDVSKVNIKISCVISFCGMSEDLANQFEITCIYSGWGFIQFVGINFWWILWNLYDFKDTYIHGQLLSHYNFWACFLLQCAFDFTKQQYSLVLMVNKYLWKHSVSITFKERFMYWIFLFQCYIWCSLSWICYSWPCKLLEYTTDVEQLQSTIVLNHQVII